MLLGRESGIGNRESQEQEQEQEQEPRPQAGSYGDSDRDVSGSWAVVLTTIRASAATSCSPLTGLRRKPSMPASRACTSSRPPERAVTAMIGRCSPGASRWRISRARSEEHTSE